MKHILSHISIEYLFIAVVILLGIAGLCFGALEQSPPPVPPDIAIKKPAASLPAQIKALSGKWTGQWNAYHGWDTMLYVEEINQTSAKVVFAWGDYHTRRESCHCSPNWVRIQEAKVTSDDDYIKLSFFTPKFRPHWLKERHTVSGSPDETYGEKAGSSGRYTFSFKTKKNEPGVMKGEFYSAKNSYLTTEMKKVE